MLDRKVLGTGAAAPTLTSLALAAWGPGCCELPASETFMNKPDRARAILRGVQQYDSDYGRDIPSRYEWVDSIREIAFGRFIIHAVGGSRIKLGHIGRGTIGEHIVADPDCLAVLISVFGDRRFAVNFAGDDVTIHHFQPGVWETTFGSEAGADTTSILPTVFENDKDPLWRRLKAECERELKRLKRGADDSSSPSLLPSC